MDIKNQSYGKVISAAYQHYITLTEVEDKYKPILTTITIPSWEGIDQYQEIDEAEAERIRSIKSTSSESIELLKEKVDVMSKLFESSINTMNLTDEQALQVKELFPNWSNFINQSIPKDFKTNYNNVLYKATEAVENVSAEETPEITVASYSPITDKATE
jgi:hypothetical protein